MEVDYLHIWDAYFKKIYWKKNWPNILQTEYAFLMYEKRIFGFGVACWICLHIFPFTIQDIINAISENLYLIEGVGVTTKLAVFVENWNYQKQIANVKR